MVRLAGGKTPETVLRYLEGIQFPVHKDVVVHTARKNGAPSDVLGALGQLPANEFGSAEELIEAYPRIE